MKVRLVKTKRRKMSGNQWERTEMVLTATSGHARRICLNTRLKSIQAGLPVSEKSRG